MTTPSNDRALPASPLPGAGRNESLLRAFELLGAIADHPSGASVAELCQASGLPRSTVSRMLASLFDIGAVARPGLARRWVIGPTILQLAGAASPLTRLQEQGAVLLRQITDELGETSMLAIPTGRTTASVVEEVRSSKIVSVIDSWVGRTVSSSASGFVRLLLAELEPAEADRLIEQLASVEYSDFAGIDPARLRAAVRQIRSDGYSVVVNELEDGLAGLGYPVRNGDELVALLAVYLPSSRFTPAFEQHALQTLQRAAGALQIFLAEDGGSTGR